MIDFQVDPAEMCFPIVPSGRSNDEIVLGPVMSLDRRQPGLKR